MNSLIVLDATEVYCLPKRRKDLIQRDSAPTPFLLPFFFFDTTSSVLQVNEGVTYWLVEKKLLQAGVLYVQHDLTCSFGGKSLFAGG